VAHYLWVPEKRAADLDPPGFGTAVAAVGPAIASRLQVVLHVEGAVLGKDCDPALNNDPVEIPCNSLKLEIRTSTGSWATPL